MIIFKEYPSPYWGLFFYQTINSLRMKIDFTLSFRPRIGDYFFITKFQQSLSIRPNSRISVPILGIIFLSEIYYVRNCCIQKRLVSVPVLGIIFYRGVRRLANDPRHIRNSVLMLGINFLSLTFLNL